MKRRMDVNSKKYFVESVTPVLPDKTLLTKPNLVDITVSALSYIATLPNPSNTSTLYFERQAAMILERKHKVSEDRQDKLIQEAYDEIIKLVVNKERLNYTELRMVRFLEQEAIGIGLKNLSEYSGIVESLDSLRAKTPRGLPNTACYLCGKVLKRYGGIKKNPHYCIRSENPECFYERTKLEKEKQKEWSYINRRCPHCKKEITVSLNMKENHYHNGEFFCSEKGYRTYRKRKQRES